MIALVRRRPGPAQGKVSLLRRFGRDQRGVYAIEFALLALPFFGLLCSTVEVSWVSFNAEQLQAAVSKAARQVMTGQAQQTSATASAFVSNVICSTSGARILPPNMDCSKLIVDVRTAADFTSLDTTNDFYKQTPLKYCLGQPSTIVVLRVIYPLETVLPLSIYNQYVGLANDVPNAPGWKHILLGTAVFETEAFQGNYSVPASC